VEGIEFSGEKHPKESHDKKCQYEGRSGKTFFGGVTRGVAGGFHSV
jgi:hypothetical protein